MTCQQSGHGHILAARMTLILSEQIISLPFSVKVGTTSDLLAGNAADKDLDSLLRCTVNSFLTVLG